MKPCSNAYAEPDFEKLVDAVYIAEGGKNTRFPYGIKSVKCSGEIDCRKAALNTVKNNWARWQTSGKTKTYLVFLRDRYAPLADSQLNVAWLENVTYFLEKGS